MRFLWIFIDGIGMGKNLPDQNPFAAEKTFYFSMLSGDPVILSRSKSFAKPIDATLGIPGYPQSATGQTAILTGENVCRKLSRHLSGLPTKTLKTVLNDKSILKTLVEKGYEVVFANAFRDSYFTNSHQRKSATTLAALAAGIPLRTIRDLEHGNALYQDFTNIQLVNKGYKLPVLTPIEAGKHLAHISSNHDFCLYEYFITDQVGHNRDMDKARREVLKIDQFVASVLSSIQLQETTITIISDHGNLEDLSVGTHTSNPVPLIAWGPFASQVLESVDDITGLAKITKKLLIQE